MRRSLAAGLLICIIALTSCSPNNGVTQADSAAHFFEITATSSVDKAADEEAQAKAVITATKHSSYPTPYATYLVPANLSTYVDPSIPTATPTAIPATATPTATQVTVVATTPASSTTPTKTTPTVTLKPGTATPTTAPTTAVPTVKPSSTPTSGPSTATPQSFSFAIQSGTPVQIQNFVNSSGCGWQGIAGQVFDLNGAPLKNVVVKAGGTWNSATVNLLGMTGIATGYGEGGYELVLGTKAVASTNTVWVQLFDLNGNALSQKVTVSTSADCTKNLVLLNFKQIDDSYNNYAPLVMQTTVP